MKVRSPAPTGSRSVDHSPLEGILSRLEGDAVHQLPRVDIELGEYLALMQKVDPDDLSSGGALAFWMNVYNAAALRLAAAAVRTGIGTVLGVPGGFDSPVISVADENLSLDDIEHGKIRRFGDPRVHGGLVCGSVSCPSLPRSPFGDDIGRQLDERMRRFLADGALQLNPVEGQMKLSPLFSWFGGDFTRPDRMPTLVPGRRWKVVEALATWMDDETVEWVMRTRPRVTWDRYDWRLGCAIG